MNTISEQLFRIQRKKRVRWWNIIKLFLITLFIVIIAAFSAGVALFVHYAKNAPKLDESKLQAKPSSVIYDKDGNVLADLSIEKRELAKTGEIPLNLVNAITSIEDKRFFKHRGVDPIRIMGSVLHNAASDTTEGGSTLTQQLIKLTYFSTKASDQTLSRKAQEAWLAVNMERQYTKEQILTFYINKVYMGNGYYGMKTAAKAYYNKSLKDLTIPQYALIAGIPQAPNQYDPYAHPKAAKTRRDTVLYTMYKNKKIGEKAYQDAIKTPIDDGLQALSQTRSVPAYLDNYIKEVVNQVKDETGLDVESAGIKIYTPLDNEAQQYLYDVFNTDQYVAYPNDQFQAATTIVDVQTGAVVAQLGSRKNTEDVTFGYNQAVSTDRDWGSTMKPVTDYGPAIENGVYTTTGQYTEDNLYYYPGTNIQVYDWDRTYMGTMTIRRALWLSRNVPAVRALAAVGLDKSLAFLEGLGINYPNIQYANAISSASSVEDPTSKYGASSENMASAFAAFGNGGIHIKPYYVNKIVFDDDTEKVFEPEKNRAMKASTAYMMTDMLKGVLLNGTQTHMKTPNLVEAGKTGTAGYEDTQLDQAIANLQASGRYYNANISIAKDELFVGFSPHYSIAVWTGYKDSLTPLYDTDLQVAGYIYKALMSHMASKVDNEDWAMPDTVYASGGELYAKD